MPRPSNNDPKASGQQPLTFHDFYLLAALTLLKSDPRAWDRPTQTAILCNTMATALLAHSTPHSDPRNPPP